MSVDGTLVPLGTPKQRAVLAMLLMNRNSPVGVDRLITAVWEGWPPSGARASIHSYVSNLRKLLSGVGIDPRGVLAAAPPGYRLSISENACDLGRFITAKNAGVHAAASGRFEHASRHLSDALAEWRGPVLEDLRDFQFVDTFATALVEDKVVAHTAKAEAEIACGRASAVIAELEALTNEHPYREPLWAQLITAYYLTDRQSDALAAYRRVKTLLADDLGIDPGQTLRDLNDKVLRQEPLDAKKRAKTTAVGTVTVLDQRTSVTGQKVLAHLYAASGEHYPLKSAATRIGRLQRQRHRPGQRQCQPPPCRYRRHRHELHHQRPPVIQRSACAVPADSHRRHAQRRRPHPHLRPRIHVPGCRGQPRGDRWFFGNRIGHRGPDAGRASIRPRRAPPGEARCSGCRAVEQVTPYRHDCSVSDLWPASWSDAVDSVSGIARLVWRSSDERRAGLAGGVDVWALSAQTAAGPRRDGRGLRGRAHRQGVDGRGQGDDRRIQQGRGVPRADETRSPHHRPAEGTPRRTDPRLWRDRRPALPGDAPDRRHRPRQHAQTVRAADPAARGGHHQPGRLGARCRARSRA